MNDFDHLDGLGQKRRKTGIWGLPGLFNQPLRGFWAFHASHAQNSRKVLLKGFRGGARTAHAKKTHYYFLKMSRFFYN